MEAVIKTVVENPSISDKKAPVDQALREEFLALLKKDAALQELTKLLSAAMELAMKDLCSASTPFSMLCDAFDSSPIIKCEEIFTFVESEIPQLKSRALFSSGRNTLLRMCNDLMRRLSKSQNTVFCGRIQLFLSRLFPLDEKSGLNLMSHFNAQNVTPFNRLATEESFVSAAVVHRTVSKESSQIKDEPDEKDADKSARSANEASASEAPAPSQEGAVTSGGPRVDYNLYVKFWSLQDYFRYPPQLYAEKVNWLAFISNVREVLSCFAGFKLDDGSGGLIKHRNDQSADSVWDQREQFTKYLTSEKLLDLQLMDSNFRRYILVQLLILFQYLNAHVKFKGSDQQLAEDQIEWVRRTTEEVHRLIRETPPKGEDFLKTILCVLEREEHWNQWKNEGCPSFIRHVTDDCNVEMKLLRKRRGNPLWDREGRKLCRFANEDLNKLWNYRPDNMDACRDGSNVFHPDLYDFFEDAIEQIDPEQKVDEEYKLVNNEGWTWRALRLLSRRSPHFYVNWPQPGIPLKAYMTSLLEKLESEKRKMKAAEEASSKFAERDSGAGTEGEIEEGMDDNGTENTDDKTEDSESNNPDSSSSQDLFHRRVAELVGDRWRELGDALGVESEALDRLEEDVQLDRIDTITIAIAEIMKLWENSGKMQSRTLSAAFNSLGVKMWSLEDPNVRR